MKWLRVLVLYLTRVRSFCRARAASYCCIFVPAWPPICRTLEGVRSLMPRYPNCPYFACYYVLLSLVKASMQLHQLLDRLEDQDKRQQETLRHRIDGERAALEATMSFSRAVAVASVEREVLLYGTLQRHG